jgi:DNA-binding protein Fis
MIVEYINNADMDDVRAILAAMEQGTPKLKDTLLATAVDTAKANYELAKQVFLHYVSHATEEDIDTLYKSLMTNQELVTVIDTVLAHFVKTYKEDVYDVLREYALHLDGTDVQHVWDTIPGNVKDYIVTQIISYLTTDDTNGTAKSQIIIPIIKNYAQTMTNAELKRLIEALEHNSQAYPLMLAQFNLWMDEYFNNHYTGGGNVANAVATAIQDRYYVCNTDVNLCHLKDTLVTLTTPTCFEVSPNNANGFSFSAPQAGYYVGTVRYTGTQQFTASLDSKIYIGQVHDAIVVSPNDYDVSVEQDADGKKIVVRIPETVFEDWESNNAAFVFEVGFNANLIVNTVADSACTATTKSIQGTYTNTQGGN